MSQGQWQPWGWGLHIGRGRVPVNEFYKKGCSIKRDVKKKVLPRPEAEKILVSRSSPLDYKCPPIAFERFCSGLFALPVGFIFRW